MTDCRKRIMFLGNCVANRLQILLAAHPDFQKQFQIEPAPMIFLVHDPAEWQRIALTAAKCDLVFTQPLFNFGYCNTAELSQSLGPEQLFVFPTPNFEAYFPDVFFLKNKKNLRFEPIFDWDSRIIFSCYAAGVPLSEVEDIYRGHSMFHVKSMRQRIAMSLERCVKRDQNTNLPIANFIAKNYANERLFYTWLHPAEQLMKYMLVGFCRALDLAPTEDYLNTAAQNGFGFNQWPIFTRHGLFHFNEQPYIYVAGKCFSLEDAATAYYNFYELHPRIVEENIGEVIPLDV